MTKEKALRYNKGKKEWSLVDYKSLEPLVDVLKFGADKYTKEIDIDVLYLIELCQKQEYAKTVKLVKELSHESFVRPAIEKLQSNMVYVTGAMPIDQSIKNLFVDHALSSYESVVLQSQLTKSENTRSLIEIDQSLKTEREYEKLPEDATQNILNIIKEESFYGGWQTTELQKSFTIELNSLGARYVKARKGYTLTMTILQENTEVFYVVSATTQLGCLMTMLNCLVKQLNISIPQNVTNGKIVNSGRDNWKLDMPIQSIVDSMMRHVVAFADGEVNDPESGLPHIGHIMCNAMFIQYHMNQGQSWPPQLKTVSEPSNPTILPEYNMSLLKAGDCIVFEKDYKETTIDGKLVTLIPSGIEFRVKTNYQNKLYITMPADHYLINNVYFIDDLKFATIRITRCNGQD